jgi:hypothetical protein
MMKSMTQNKLKHRQRQNLNCPSKGQVETAKVLAENLLTYADLLRIDWILGETIDDWEWRHGDGLDDLVENGRGTLGRVREMIRVEEKKGGES